MNQAEPMVWLTVGADPLGEQIRHPLQNVPLGIAKSRRGAPVAPERPRAQHGLEVPGLALEGGRPLPRSTVLMKPGGQRAKLEEPCGQRCSGIRLVSAHMLERYHLSCRAVQRHRTKQV